jgi:CheY-like chemotaxis protein
MDSIYKPLSVLLVEDNKDHVNILRWIIGKVHSGIDVSHAEDAEAVMKSLGTRSASPLPDIILMDLNLPKVSGMELLKFIRRESHLRHIPVLMLSSSNRPEDVHEAYRHGANTFLNKAVIFDDFETTAHRIIEYWATIALLPR